MKKIFLFSLLLLCQIAVMRSQTPGYIIGMTNNSYTGYATMFSYDPLTGRDSLLFYFSPPTGNQPYGACIQALNGKIYGLTNVDHTYGTLFCYDFESGKVSDCISFTGANGATPFGSLIQGRDSLLYGVTEQGGAFGNGVLFSYNTVTGKDSTRLSFNGSSGASPNGTLLQATDSLIYGMTYSGGTYNYGVLFSFNPKTNAQTVLVNFNDTNGAHPIYGALIQDTNGLLYGTTTLGGTSNYGVLFSYNIKTGKDSVLYNFGYSYGGQQYGNMISDTNGFFYGMTNTGGLHGYGTLFRYEPANGKDTDLFNFSTPSGISPQGNLYIGSNGLLYGMTHEGGTYAEGTFLSYNLNTNKDSVLLNFNDTIGAYPFGSPSEIMSTIVSGKDSLKCYGDSGGWVKINVRGDKPPVSYHWSDGSTSDSIGNLKAGTYSFTVKDSRGITISDSVHIYQPGKITPAPSVSNDCYGDSSGIARAFVSGGTSPFHYLWGDGATIDSIMGLKPGTYSCTVTDYHGCTTTVTCNITQAQPLKIDSIISIPPTWPTYNNGAAKVYVSGGIPAGDSSYVYFQYYYSWSPGSDSITLVDSLTIQGLTSGTIYINVTNACGLVQDSISVPMGIQDIHTLTDAVKVYPVPSEGIITVEMAGTGYERITITDVYGRKISEKTIDPEQFSPIMNIDLSGQPDGIYLLQIVTGKEIETRKIIINK